jgi:hypothetical protein
MTSQAAYTVERVKVGLVGGIENYISGMVQALLSFPAYDGGGFWKGGYAAGGERTRDEIQVKLQL